MPLKPSLLAMVLLSACRHTGGSPTDQWARWFDQMASELGTSDGSRLPTPRGPQVLAPDGLSVRLGLNFQQRNDSGCWDVGVDKWPGPGWRDVCISRIVADGREAPDFFLRFGPSDPEMVDQLTSEEWRADATKLGGRRAIVERALVSGGMAGAKRQRWMSILVELPRGGWAHVSGRTGDDDGYAEILGSAATIESQ